MNAISHTLSVTWKEIQLILKDRGSLALAFLLPLLLGVVMGGTNLAANPEQEAAILLRVGLIHEIMDHTGDFLFVSIRIFESLEGRTPASLRLVDGVEGYSSAAVCNVFIEPHGVSLLLLGLHVHPLSETAQIYGLEAGGH